MEVFAQAIAEAGRLLVTLDPELVAVVLVSLRVSATALALAALVGVPAGYLLGIGRFAWNAFIILFVNTGMGLPPVVVGLAVYLTLSRSGPLGDLSLLFTPAAMVVAQTVIALPLVTGVTVAAVAAVPRDLRLQARALGAGRLEQARVTLFEARRGVLAALIAGFGGIISEVGAVMMVGGNIEGSTRVMTTAIVLETRKGNFGLAMSWGLILVGIALVVNAVLTLTQFSGARYER